MNYLSNGHWDDNMKVYNMNNSICNKVTKPLQQYSTVDIVDR